MKPDIRIPAADGDDCGTGPDIDIDPEVLNMLKQQV